jgi:hypothetical protein
MKAQYNMIAATLTACALLAAAATGAQAQTIVNGGFESGLLGWTSADQLGSDGTFLVQTGPTSPVNGFAVPVAPEGLNAAMTDSGAGGSHALYQDFAVPAVVQQTFLRFSLYLNNGADAYFVPAHLDWARTSQTGGLTLNQQARVDLMGTGADPFSTAAGDVLANLFATTTSTPAVAGYLNFDIDITAVLQAHAGETLRLRFAEVDNVNFFNLGVDNVRLVVVPTPASGAIGLGLLALAGRRRR